VAKKEKIPDALAKLDLSSRIEDIDWDKFWEEHNTGYIIAEISSLKAGDKTSRHEFFSDAEAAHMAAFKRDHENRPGGPRSLGVFKAKKISTQRYCHGSDSYYVEIIEPVFQYR
jgi:hypothetical protein